MKRKPIIKESRVHEVNQIPFKDAVWHVKNEQRGIADEEMAGKLGISTELFTSYLDGSELPPDDLSPRLLDAYQIGIHRISGTVSARPHRQPPSPPAK
ncbi:MAG TPA: hypothetical protein VL547_07725 [Dinghuibacter sp.]|uniref:hypothetical protein n=1 Tax=Dinghuibacter sp. TaxID=2024697 RepID=UPI002CD58C2F|nr:hypothetical protein [Dinghuibacter sp.]HTJ11897.1 hypothetical protein [Dinghuibacter sp.]